MNERLSLGPDRPLHRPAHTTRRIGRTGAVVNVRVGAAETGGAWSLLESAVPPGAGGPPPHWHAETTETFVILEGALVFTMDGEEVTAHAGDTVVVPPRTAHSFCNPFNQPCRLLSHVTPGGLEDFFEAAAALARQEPPPSPARRASLGARYDNFVVSYFPLPEPLPDLLAA